MNISYLLVLVLQTLIFEKDYSGLLHLDKLYAVSFWCFGINLLNETTLREQNLTELQ